MNRGLATNRRRSVGEALRFLAAAAGVRGCSPSRGSAGVAHAGSRAIRPSELLSGDRRAVAHPTPREGRRPGVIRRPAGNPALAKQPFLCITVAGEAGWPRPDEWPPRTGRNSREGDRSPPRDKTMLCWPPGRPRTGDRRRGRATVREDQAAGRTERTSCGLAPADHAEAARTARYTRRRGPR